MKLVNAEDITPPINRSLLIVRVKAPFIEWANSIDDGPKADFETYEPSAYLVDEIDGPEQLALVERRAWKPVFEHELANWDRDPDSWPQHRKLAMFRQWFSVELHPGVYDVGAGPITET